MKQTILMITILAALTVTIAASAAVGLDESPSVPGVANEAADFAPAEPSPVALATMPLAAVLGAQLQWVTIPAPNCELWPPNCRCNCLGACQRAFEACFDSCGSSTNNCQLSCVVENSCCVDECCGVTPQHCT